MSINIKRSIKRGQNKPSTGLNPEQPCLSSMTRLEQEMGLKVSRGPFQPQPLGAQDPKPSSHQRVVGDRDNLPVGSGLSQPGGTCQQERLYSHPSTGDQKALPGPVFLRSSQRGGGTCLHRAPHRSPGPANGPGREGERTAG